MRSATGGFSRGKRVEMRGVTIKKARILRCGPFLISEYRLFTIKTERPAARIATPFLKALLPAGIDPNPVNDRRKVFTDILFRIRLADCRQEPAGDRHMAGRDGDFDRHRFVMIATGHPSPPFL
ncbi:hypothetical protein [Devosia marina]|uniref:Uncharacterized protein n=1 Tax=Devosia marina TaxID=2683198 RepID=A0A7X3FS95_9HYPH|nr:hypothetical protein [Devosia marina]MVS99809.1 hypothetical protein [Devosia marina]